MQCIFLTCNILLDRNRSRKKSTSLTAPHIQKNQSPLSHVKKNNKHFTSLRLLSSTLRAVSLVEEKCLLSKHWSDAYLFLFYFK